jgi:hypothetical protein
VSKYFVTFYKGNKMELVIGLVIIVGVAYWLYTRNTKEAAPAEAPYKVETPVVAQEVKEVIPEAVVVAPAEVVAEIVVVAPVEVAVEPAPVEPVKKARKPRVVKTVVKTVEKAAKVTKVAAKAPKVTAKAATTPARKPAAIKAKSKKA